MGINEESFSLIFRRRIKDQLRERKKKLLHILPKRPPNKFIDETYCSHCTSIFLSTSMYSTILITIDNSDLARVSRMLLSDQTKMELLIGKIHDQSNFRDKKGVYTDFKTWNGIDVEADGTLRGISWEHDPEASEEEMVEDDEQGTTGTIELQWIPSSLEYFSASKMSLSGSVETIDLPRSLLIFVIDFNFFEGTFETSGLPDTLFEVNITDNNFLGSLDLTSLPSSTENFFAARNSFFGSLDFTLLPQTLQNISVYHNRFDGEVDLRYLPKHLKTLHMDKNGFTQSELVIKNNLPDLVEITVDSNFKKIADTSGYSMIVSTSSDGASITIMNDMADFD